MEVEMARPKLHTVPRLDRREIRQHAALEAVGLDRTRVHRIVPWGIVAARDHYHLLVVRSCTDLMRVFACVERVRLVHPVADRAVLVDVVHSKGARVVVRCEQILALHVDAGMDRTRRQVLRLTVLSQRARSRIDAERMGEVLVAGDTRAAAARHNVEVVFQGMRPRVLDVGR